MIRLLLRVTICLHIYTQYTQYKLNWWLNVNLNPPHAILSLVWRSSVLQLLSVWVFSTVCTWGLSRSYWCAVHCPLQGGRSLTQYWNATVCNAPFFFGHLGPPADYSCFTGHSLIMSKVGWGNLNGKQQEQGLNWKTIFEPAWLDFIR